MIKEFYERNQARYQQAKIKVIYIAFKPTAPVVGAVPQAQVSRRRRARAFRRRRRQDPAHVKRTPASWPRIW